MNTKIPIVALLASSAWLAVVPVANAATTVITNSYTAAAWTFGRSDAYPAPDSAGTQRNPNDGKLDCINPKWSAPTGTTFSAVRSGSCWNADFATSKVLIKTGDTVTYNVTPGTARGAWPSIWSFRNGGNEIDFFEYHSDFAKQVEFANHVNGHACYSQTVTPGQPYQITVKLTTKAVTWQSKGGYVLCRQPGLPAGWSSYLIVNMSVDSGMWSAAQGPPSAGVNSLSFRVNSLTVTR